MFMVNGSRPFNGFCYIGIVRMLSIFGIRSLLAKVILRESDQ